jgi:muramoyltetrapeptide carboxypeptidase LdcA involved in peptidoglycan recycling
MKKPIIHLLSIAGTTRKVLDDLRFGSATALIRFVQDAVGDRYKITGDRRLIEAPEDDYHGGRDDDARRAADLQKCLADSATAAAVTLRGGAWLTRILPRVDFTVLNRRRTRIAIFGFSEITTLVNIAAQYRRAYAFYDMGPGFLRAGMEAYARANYRRLTGKRDAPTETVDAFAAGWANGQFRARFAEFFRDVVDIVEGRGSSRSITGELLSGALPARSEAVFCGGNLTLLAPLVGTPYARAGDAAGRWVALEDIKELPEHIDRKLGHLTVAGAWSRCRGLLIGDFRSADRDLRDAVLSLLKYHLPPDRKIPVVGTKDVGHIWPLAPLPIGRPVKVIRTAARGRRPTVRFQPPWEDWRIR